MGYCPGVKVKAETVAVKVVTDRVKTQTLCFNAYVAPVGSLRNRYGPTEST